MDEPSQPNESRFWDQVAEWLLALREAKVARVSPGTPATPPAPPLPRSSF
ncbi:MAG TPA: hypothetical protein VL593_08155 [Ramlibacter sp.]|nr:hypothetical protein [Ramlibacter sp.]